MSEDLRTEMERIADEQAQASRDEIAAAEEAKASVSADDRRDVTVEERDGRLVECRTFSNGDVQETDIGAAPVIEANDG